ncbi:MAG: glutamyl-tRNA amidotransferase [Marmoricola sp.]|nr:glutamyl-tRNA amidotransferase [Marmoricola sp.]
MTLPGLTEAFWAYERALMANDLDTLDRLFAPGPTTLRGDAAGLLVGHDAISAFRGGRGGAPARTIVETHVQVIDATHALVVAVTELASGGRGQQTQLWALQDQAWVVTAAHVSIRAAAFDPRIWRLVGDPLVPPAGTGHLDGETVAVKDLYAVAGQRVGAGNPAWLEHAEPEAVHAWAVQRLLDDGAAVRGISRTDEFAYSLAGTNAHYGTPPNPKAPHRISGGSSSGSASAVAMGHATIGLGTDTGGSIRVPAAYQGLWGIRTTHGAVNAEGVLPLSGSFDTVGWLTREPGLLARVGRSLLPADSAVPGDVVTVDALLALAEPAVASAVGVLAAGVATIDWPFDVAAMLPVFQTLQAYEAWQQHGAWVESRMDTLGADVRGRFERAATITAAEAAQAQGEVAGLRERIRAHLGDRVLLLPSASSAAPLVNDAAALDAVRTSTMQLTCIAGIGGLPAVGIPVTTADGLPAGACLVGPAGSDRALIALAEGFADRGHTQI